MDVIYSSEFIGSLILVVHGLIGMILLEHMKSVKVARVLGLYSKAGLLVYPLLVILYVTYYVQIVPMLQPASSD